MITIDDVNIGRILTCDEFSCAIIALGIILTTKNNEKNLLLCVYFQKWVGISKTFDDANILFLSGERSRITTKIQYNMYQR